MGKGKIHTITVSNNPKMRTSYRRLGGNAYLDGKFKDVGGHFIEAVKYMPRTYINLEGHDTVHGRSWEMAAIKAIQGDNGTFSGIVSGANMSEKGGTIQYGPVFGKGIKHSMVSELESFDNDKRDDIHFKNK
jgi:hypothetical protein